MKHVAGPAISVDNDLIVQRCCCCGVVLLSDHLSLTMAPKGTPGYYPVWEMGDIIEVEGENPKMSSKVGRCRDMDVGGIPGVCVKEG